MCCSRYSWIHAARMESVRMPTWQANGVFSRDKLGWVHCWSKCWMSFGIERVTSCKNKRIHSRQRLHLYHTPCCRIITHSHPEQRAFSPQTRAVLCVPREACSPASPSPLALGRRTAESASGDGNLRDSREECIRRVGIRWVRRPGVDGSGHSLKRVSRCADGAFFLAVAFVTQDQTNRQDQQQASPRGCRWRLRRRGEGFSWLEMFCSAGVCRGGWMW